MQVTTLSTADLNSTNPFAINKIGLSIYILSVYTPSFTIILSKLFAASIAS